MSERGAPTVSASLEVPAAAEVVYGWLTDLDTFAGLTEETFALRWVEGDTARPGARFEGDNRSPVHTWTTTCVVTDADGQRFGFDVTYPVRGDDLRTAHWEYVVQPVGADTCRVTESAWDHRPDWFVEPAETTTGVPDRNGANQRHIEATLERIRERAARG